MRVDGAEWDISGHFALIDNRSGRAGGIDCHVRCSAGGRATVNVNGVTIPIRPEMTASEYFDTVFRHTFGAPEDRRAVGD